MYVYIALWGCVLIDPIICDSLSLSVLHISCVTALEKQLAASASSTSSSSSSSSSTATAAVAPRLASARRELARNLLRDHLSRAFDARPALQQLADAGVVATGNAEVRF